MIRLVYVSSAVKEMEQEELVALLEQSRKKNSELNLTGMLLYGGGNFIQILEGETEAVNTLYEKILKDERHTDCILIDKSEISEPTFKGWSMGFRQLTPQDSSSLDGYTEFLNRKIPPQTFAHKADSILGLLYGFKQNL